VDGRALSAPSRRSAAGGWQVPLRPRVDDLSRSDREALASAWLRDALLEHASVASFSRFALELIAVGAPARLLEAAHQAALDEVRHARLRFALASAYAGEDLEPGPLPLGGALEIASDLATVAARAVAEGCIGETVAALTAAEQHAVATDPSVRDVLAGIAEDEARHAELAWSFVAWAIRTGGRNVHDAVARAFTGALAAHQPPPREEIAEGALAAHGWLSEEAVRGARRRAIQAVVMPGARELAITAAACG
jgi:hypothetical protein